VGITKSCVLLLVCSRTIYILSGSLQSQTGPTVEKRIQTATLVSASGLETKLDVNELEFSDVNGTLYCKCLYVESNEIGQITLIVLSLLKQGMTVVKIINICSAQCVSKVGEGLVVLKLVLIFNSNWQFLIFSLTL